MVLVFLFLMLKIYLNVMLMLHIKTNNEIVIKELEFQMKLHLSKLNLIIFINFTIIIHKIDHDYFIIKLTLINIVYYRHILI